MDAAHPLGRAVAQILDTFIIAEAADGSLVLVDQHAAHERLTHEALSAQLRDGGVRAQPLLVPAVVDMPPADAARLLGAAEALARLGLEIEGFGAGAVLLIPHRCCAIWRKNWPRMRKAPPWSASWMRRLRGLPAMAAFAPGGG
jgi:DNA mismatch repair ATPase MutL